MGKAGQLDQAGGERHRLIGIRIHRPGPPRPCDYLYTPDFRNLHRITRTLHLNYFVQLCILHF